MDLNKTNVNDSRFILDWIDTTIILFDDKDLALTTKVSAVEVGISY